VISVVWDKRAFPYNFELLPKLGSSNVHEQKSTIFKVLPLFDDNYKIAYWETESNVAVKLTGLESRMYILPASQKK